LRLLERSAFWKLGMVTHTCSSNTYEDQKFKASLR
jgi:hypothetical protein